MATTSKREQLQDELIEFIERQGYDAPYGVIKGLTTLPKGGKVRTITFGMKATLDAEIAIFSDKLFALNTQGRLSREFKLSYTSLEDLKRDLYEAVN